MKKCIKCQESKKFSEFEKRLSAKDGLRNTCKICVNANKRENYAKDASKKILKKEYYKRNAETIRLRENARYARDSKKRIEQAKTYYAKNREKVLGKVKEYYALNIDSKRKYDKERWADRYKRDKAQYAKRARAWEKRLLQAQPFWADRSLIAKAYEACDYLSMVTGEWYEVDHIVPLRHPLVCGLHVPHNLQILTRAENRSKSNKFIVE